MNLGPLNVEAIFFAPGDKTHLHVISDDGGRKIGGKDCKKVGSKAQSFRAMSLIILPAQPVDATQALNLSAGVSNCKVSRGRSFS